jgi:outer membrane protein assembly factor BamD (BamD/ComL family)
MIKTLNIKLSARFMVKLLFLSLFLLGCMSRFNKGRLVKVNDAQYTIAEAHNLYDIGEIESAVLVLRNYVEMMPYNHSHDEAYELIVLWLLQTHQLEQAKKVASFFLSHYGTSKSAQTIVNLLTESLNHVHAQSAENTPADHEEVFQYYENMP